ncbi:MAG TPA: hypothetical protein ENH29_03050, partial [Bacteroidetes bacterium]|nr:hypothetical protein [Bacteroidota bacterium]
PFFGKNRSDKKDGTPLIFEVRGHDVNVSLCDDEPLAKLIFYRMSEDSKFKKLVKMGNNIDLYNEQTLQLSGIFDDWPKKIKIHEDGRVEEL